MKKALIILILLFIVPHLGSHYQDEQFFAHAEEPDVLLILDTSASMNFNMHGNEPCRGDGTRGADTTIGGVLYRDPFFGYRENWGPQSGTDDNGPYPSCPIQVPRMSGDSSRMYIVKEAILTVLEEYQGRIRWGLASFYQASIDSCVNAAWRSTDWYRAYDSAGTGYITPNLQKFGSWKPYARQQFKLWCNMPEAQGGSNSAQLNNIRKYVNSYWGPTDDPDEPDTFELRSTCTTPIAPALRGARYWYVNEEIHSGDLEEKKCRSHFVILLTDGEPTVGINGAGMDAPPTSPPNYNSPQWMKHQCFTEAQALRNTTIVDGGEIYEFDIRTFVIGIGPSASQITMDSIAIMGGTEHYYPANNQEEVAAALSTIFDIKSS